jgi:hypothetical protein
VLEMMDSNTIFVARTKPHFKKKKGRCVVVFVGALALNHVGNHVLVLLNRFQ